MRIHSICGNQARFLFAVSLIAVISGAITLEARTTRVAISISGCKADTIWAVRGDGFPENKQFEVHRNPILERKGILLWVGEWPGKATEDFEAEGTIFSLRFEYTTLSVNGIKRTEHSRTGCRRSHGEADLLTDDATWARLDFDCNARTGRVITPEVHQGDKGFVKYVRSLTNKLNEDDLERCNVAGTLSAIPIQGVLPDRDELIIARLLRDDKPDWPGLILNDEEVITMANLKKDHALKYKDINAAITAQSGRRNPWSPAVFGGNLSDIRPLRLRNDIEIKLTVR